MVALVDDKDFDRVNAFSWIARRTHNVIYAVRSDTHRGTTYLHRFILEPQEDEKIDHIDHNGLNCTRGNMRIVSHQANMINRRTSNETGYRGVYHEKRTDRYCAQIKDLKGNRYSLGTFDTPEEAAHAYNEAARLYHGEFARLNLLE